MPVPIRHRRGNFPTRHVTTAIQLHHPSDIGSGQAVLGKKVHDGCTECGISVDQSVVQVQQQKRQRHDRK